LNRAGVWGWLMQRITAALLAVVLGVHLYVLHFSGEHAALTVAGVSIRLKSLAYLLVDYSLLAAALYHGLYGLRSVLLDYISGGRTERALTVAVWVVGLGAFVYGVYALAPFILG
jgi:succinate dehydrogenase / fumarate reductase membrane anchor subunit